jgi:hypothetical protein
LLISQHIAMNGDDGSTDGAASWRNEGGSVIVAPSPDTELARRFPSGSFAVTPLGSTEFQRVGGDELLFADGRSRNQPYICIVTAPARAAVLRIRGQLVPEADPPPLRVEKSSALAPHLKMSAPPQGRSVSIWRASRTSLPGSRTTPSCTTCRRAAWSNTRAAAGVRATSARVRSSCCWHSGESSPIRDLLLRVMSAQNADGDWPQWFMFFERDQAVRAGDSHGDIVFWPVLALAQYLIVSGDKSLLDEQVAGATVWQHAERALALDRKRVVPDTALPRMDTEIGTTLCSQPTPRCASTCAAPGP